MKKSTKKILVLLVVIIVYFFISYDVIEVPCKITFHPDQQTWNTQIQNVYHTKLFGDIPVITGVSGDMPWATWHYEKEVRPIDGKMWVVNLIDWFKVVLISVLFIALFINSDVGSEEEIDYDHLIQVSSVVGIIWGLGTLLDQSLSYGFSEIFILVLFLANCLIPQKE